MKSISLKLKDVILEETEQVLTSLNISRNKYINEAIAHYNKHQKRKLLEAKLQQESALVAEDSLIVLHEFEALEDDYTI